MTDLTQILPDFPTSDYVRLIPPLERAYVTTSDLITQNVAEIAKRARLPLLDLKRLCDAVLQALQSDLKKDVFKPNTISTLDGTLDDALGGGIPTGYITEVVGESGAGKTQFLLGLLLSAQLPAPHGVSRSSLYISTESALPTIRLSQMLSSNQILAAADPPASLDRVISIVTPDLESQDHIIKYQLPVAIKKYNIGLVVIDSVASNYRAEFERPGVSRNGENMAKRSGELIKLGQLLRELAISENVAIVVSNQVADRFGGGYGNSSPAPPRMQSSPLAHRPIATPSSSISGPSSSMAATAAELGLSDITSTDPISLDHQQRWFTGWGDDPSGSDFKTPSLGLVWTSQIACRVALIKKPVYERAVDDDDAVLKAWRRWMRVVFAPWCASGVPGLRGAVEFKITQSGLVTATQDS